MNFGYGCGYAVLFREFDEAETCLFESLLADDICSLRLLLDEWSLAFITDRVFALLRGSADLLPDLLWADLSSVVLALFRRRVVLGDSDLCFRLADEPCFEDLCLLGPLAVTGLYSIVSPSAEICL